MHRLKRAAQKKNLKLSNVAKSLGIKASDDDIKKLMKRMDTNSSYQISFHEFFTILLQILNFSFKCCYVKSQVNQSLKAHSRFLIKIIQVNILFYI